MLRRIEPCCATGTNVPVWLSSSRTLLTESDSLRGCYELGPERLTNAENRARRRTDLTEKAAFPCGLFAEFITLSRSHPEAVEKHDGVGGGGLRCAIVGHGDLLTSPFSSRSPVCPMRGLGAPSRWQNSCTAPPRSDGL